jgi:hypothetical protein
VFLVPPFDLKFLIGLATSGARNFTSAAPGRPSAPDWNAATSLLDGILSSYDLACVVGA